VGDEDWVRFWSAAGTHYTLKTFGLGETTDTGLTLFAADGVTPLAENDDIVLYINLASRIEWIAEMDGWLYLRARHYSPHVAGNAVSYLVSVEQEYSIYLPVVGRK
jgi:hypothetical protein